MSLHKKARYEINYCTDYPSTCSVNTRSIVLQTDERIESLISNGLQLQTMVAPPPHCHSDKSLFNPPVRD